MNKLDLNLAWLKLNVSFGSAIFSGGIYEYIYDKLANTYLNLNKWSISNYSNVHICISCELTILPRNQHQIYGQRFLIEEVWKIQVSSMKKEEAKLFWKLP